MCNSLELVSVLGQMADIRYRALLAGRSSQEVADRIFEAFPKSCYARSKGGDRGTGTGHHFARHGLPLIDNSDPRQYGFDF